MWKERGRWEGIPQTFRHFSHDHELVSVTTRCRSDSKNCNACGGEIIPSSGTYAKCFTCKLFWHKPCLQVPKDITHPFHPEHSLTQLYFNSSGSNDITCHACGNYCQRLTYQCSKCRFYLHDHCAAPTPSKTTTVSSTSSKLCPLSNRESPHPLILCDINFTTTYDFACTICRKMLPNKVQKSALYVCLECKLAIHRSCADQLLPSEITNHPIHPAHSLIIYQQPPGEGSNFECYATRIGLGLLYYKCYQCSDFRMLASCASLTEIGSTTSSHLHPVIHLNFDPRNFLQLCYGCNDLIRDSICFCRQCRIFLHKSCAELPHQIQHACHPHNPLVLQDYKTAAISKGDRVSCKACSGDIKGFFYHCTLGQSQYLNLHIKCTLESRLYPPIESSRHDHPLAYFKTRIKCNDDGGKCCKHCSRDDWEPDDPIFSCLQPQCEFYIHAHCLPKSELPTTVKNIHHLHTLTLTDSGIKDRPDEDMDSEFYCDSCEERRKLHNATYYCAECYFVAHVDCNISEVIDHFLLRKPALTEELRSASDIWKAPHEERGGMSFPELYAPFEKLWQKSTPEKSSFFFLFFFSFFFLLFSKELLSTTIGMGLNRPFGVFTASVLKLFRY